MPLSVGIQLVSMPQMEQGRTVGTRGPPPLVGSMRQITRADSWYAPEGWRFEGEWSLPDCLSITHNRHEPLEGPIGWATGRARVGVAH